MIDIQQAKKDRYRFLYRLYELTGGNRLVFPNMWKIGEELSFEREYTRNIMDYLVQEMLAEYKHGGGGIAITHFGRKEVEEAIQEPDHPTEHFLPINIIQINSMNNSQIVQGSPHGSIDSEVLSQSEQENLRPLLTELLEFVKKLEQEQDEKDTVIADIKTALSQLESPKPHKSIVSALLQSIWHWTKSLPGESATYFVLRLAETALFEAK